LVVFNSAHEGVRKPDQRIYRVLLDQLGAAASQCLFVDDDPANCAAAQALGMHVVHFGTTDDAIDQVRAVLRRTVPGEGPTDDDGWRPGGGR
jgi:putative hydrolase of the HAD superfamily